MEAPVKTTSWQAFRNGLTRSIRYPQVILCAYLFNLLTGLLLAVIPALTLVDPAHRTAIQDAANGIDMWLVEEILGSTTTYSILQETASGPPPWLQQASLVVFFILLAVPVLAWLTASFLRGGILLAYVEAPQPFSWQRFFWGCWHWFGAFLLINLLLEIATLLLMSILLVGIVMAASAAGAWINWITLSLLVLIIVPWLAISDYTHLFAVVDQTRNVFKAFGKAFILIFRRPLALAGLFGLSLLMLLLIQAAFRILLPSLPPDWWPLVFVVTQVFIIARLWSRLVRWAGAVDIT
ncbi:MAG: hypothetical protein JXB07_05075 [Anaerolineae bacterium]|nr:hypothetical protein [Anaerolineae bacterium]